MTCTELVANMGEVCNRIIEQGIYVDEIASDNQYVRMRVRKDTPRHLIDKVTDDNNCCIVSVDCEGTWIVVPIGGTRWIR